MSWQTLARYTVSVKTFSIDLLLIFICLSFLFVTQFSPHTCPSGQCGDFQLFGCWRKRCYGEMYELKVVHVRYMQTAAAVQQTDAATYFIQ